MSGLTRRQAIAAGGTLLATSSLALPALAQPADGRELRIGTIAPSSSGLTVIPASINDHIGDAARQGALVAEAEIGDAAAAEGTRLVLLTANSPTVEAADRAGRRMVSANGIHAIVGGVGEGQAEVLSTIAEEAGIPFFNIGSMSLSLRARCRRFTFHIEASAAMYLDAIAFWGGARGYRRWFIVHQDDEEGAQLRARAVEAVLRHGDGGEIVGAASAFPAQPFYGSQIDAAANANADAILVLLSDVDQIAFVAQQENFDPVIPSLLLPYPNTQTRDYIAAFRQYAPVTNPDFRFALWDTTLTGHGAAAFNTRYVTRWGDPADPPAWSAYQAINILRQAVAAVGGVDGPALADYLSRSEAVFDVLKGPGISFRPWNHQLRQPLYLVRVDQEAVWDRNVPSSRIAIASYAGTVPEDGPGGAVERLDLLGEGPEVVDCRV